MLIALWITIVVIGIWAAVIQHRLNKNDNDHVRLLEYITDNKNDIDRLDKTKCNKGRSKHKPKGAEL